MIVVGMDPALSNFGWAIVDYRSPGDLDIIAMGIIRTKKGDKKEKPKVSASEDCLRRTQFIVRKLVSEIDSILPAVQAFAIEAMSFPRNSSAAAKIALSFGAIATLSESYNSRIFQVSPKDLKMAVCGFKSAEKEDVMEALRKRYKDQIDPLLKCYPKSIHNHAYDALGAIISCQERLTEHSQSIL